MNMNFILFIGLYQGMEMFNTEVPENNKIQSIFLFTDGQPNIEPPRGHIPMFKKYKDEHPKL